MTSSSPDILQQALAEVSPYISGEAATEADPYISKETDNLVQDVQSLCSRLAEEGEETLFVSVNVAGNQCAYLGSTFGKDYIERNNIVQGFFQYCNDKYTNRGADVVIAPPPPPPPQPSGTSDQMLGNLTTILPAMSQQKAAVGSHPTPTTGTTYRSLLTKSSIQEIAQRSLNANQVEVQKTAEIHVAENTKVTQNDSPDMAACCQATDNRLYKSGGKDFNTDKVNLGGTMETSTPGYSDKSIATDFPDDASEDDPINKVTVSNSAQRAKNTEKKIIVYVEKKKSQDSGVEENVIVYKSPEEVEEKMLEVSQKNTLEKLGLVESDGTKSTASKEKTGQEKTTQAHAAEDISNRAKAAEQTKQNKVETDKKFVSDESENKMITKKKRGRPRTEGENKKQPTPQTQVKGREKSLEINTGSFHMRTRSGGKVKHMPWLKKYGSDQDEDSEEETDSKRDENKACSPRSQSEHSVKRQYKRKGASSGETPKKIKLEMDSNEDVTTETPGTKERSREGITGDEGQGELSDSQEKAEKSQHSCTICGEKFKEDFELTVHHEVKHDITQLYNAVPGQKDEQDCKYVCEICGKDFPDLKELNAHHKSHNKEDLSCNPSENKISPECNVSKHVQCSHNKKRFPCTECTESLASERQRDEHMCIVHKHPRVYRCTNKDCGKTFSDPKDFYRHYKEHATPCVCEYCGKSFFRKTELMLHRRMHTKEKPIKCNVCGRGFARSSTYISHKLTHRTYNAFQCEVCGRTFKTKESMRQHKKVHTKESTVPCKYCELKFRTFDGMKNHVIQHHTGVQLPSNWNVYACKDCPKKFGAKQQYIRHISVHTGLRPHQCDICDKRYPTLGSLNTHKKVHKQNMPDNPFQCLVCNVSFRIISKMKRHMETAKHIQYCMGVGVDPQGNLKEYETKIAAEGNLRAHEGTVTVPADGSVPIVVKKEIENLAEYENDETVECVLIHLPDDEIALEDGAQIVYSINTDDGTIESVFHESVPAIDTTSNS